MKKFLIYAAGIVLLNLKGRCAQGPSVVAADDSCTRDFFNAFWKRSAANCEGE